MGQVLHGSARTTEAVRRAIQLRQESVRALAKRYGVSPTTVQKWRKRSTTADAPMGPKEPRSTVLTREEEAIVVAFRRHTLLNNVPNKHERATPAYGVPPALTARIASLAYTKCGRHTNTKRAIFRNPHASPEAWTSAERGMMRRPNRVVARARAYTENFTAPAPSFAGPAGSSKNMLRIMPK